jgi:hypothetical protein
MVAATRAVAVTAAAGEAAAGAAEGEAVAAAAGDEEAVGEAAGEAAPAATGDAFAAGDGAPVGSRPALDEQATTASAIAAPVVNASSLFIPGSPRTFPFYPLLRESLKAFPSIQGMANVLLATECGPINAAVYARGDVSSIPSTARRWRDARQVLGFGPI